MIARCLALLLFALGPVAPAAAQVDFPVAFDASAGGLTSTERTQLTTHLQAAGAQWVAVMDIDGPRSIEIMVFVDTGGPRANGGSFTTAYVGESGGRQTWEQGAAAELRTGTDPNGAEPDVRITVDSSYLRDELWFDPDPLARTAPVDVNRTDAMSVALHELGHAFAYNGWADGQGVPPPTYWSTFDRWMIAGAPTRFDGPEVVDVHGSAPELTSGNIHHWANGPVPRPAPTHRDAPRWREGVPLPGVACEGLPSADAPPSRHADAKGSLPPGLLYELMNGVVFYRGSRYEISPLDVAALADVGLPVIGGSLFADGFEP